MKLTQNNKQNINENVGKTFLGLSGVIWCLLAGLGYGTQNVFAKLAYERHLKITTFILMRHLVLLTGAYIFGKLRGINFDYRAYPRKTINLVLKRCILSAISKSMQYAAISFIPLTLSICISFTTGPIFNAILAFLLIREKLSGLELLAIALGILGTAMLTMPEWFQFLNIDGDMVARRLQHE